jgi:hypothetical protein
MKRLLVIGAGLAVAGGAWADPPLAGRERTQVEQELYLPEPPAKAVVSGPVRSAEPGAPHSTTVAGVRGWLLRLSAGQLGMAPLVKQDVW